MQLTALRIHNFRCITEAELTPAPGINLVLGDNASGKSSLLEAIYFLGRAQSFRSTPRDRLIQSGAHELSVFGRTQNSTGAETAIGIQRANRHSRIKIGTQEDASTLDLIAALPIQVIDPRLHQLLEEGPEQRRRFLDWGVFHVEPTFYPSWQRFQRALRQRNSALRARLPARQVSVWNAELTQQAEILDGTRRRYLALLAGILPDIMHNLLNGSTVSVDYHAGWPDGQTFDAALDQGLQRDQELGFTHNGPHRADLKVRMQGLQARARASRGEQKLISAGLLLAQAKLVHIHQGRRPILLIDDLAAELDAQSRSQLFGAIHELGAQSFLSFLEPGQIPQDRGRDAMFHVEHGHITRCA